MAFRYKMTDISKTSLESRVEEAEGRGFRKHGEIYTIGHHPMVTKRDVNGKKSHSMSFTAGKFGVVMEKVEAMA